MKSKRLLLLLLVALMAPWAAMAQNRQIVEIGTGSSTDYYPMPGYWGFQYDVYLYTPSAAPELGVDSDISSIAYNLSSTSSSTGATIEIWVKDVDASFALASSTTFADYISGATKVVDDNAFTTDATGWKTMNFSSTFSHQGGKALLVAVRGVGCSTTGGCSRKCYYTSASNMHWAKHKDSSDPDTSATGSLDGERSNIRLDVTYTGSVCFAPTNLTCTAYTATTATLGWTENGEATSWVLQYSMDNTFATGVQSVNVSTTSSTQLTSLTAETTYYARVKPDCDTDGTKWSNVCEFKPTAAQNLTVNDESTTNSYIPIYGNYVDWGNRSQFIIPAASITDMTGATINKITLYAAQSSTTFTNDEFSVYMKEVSSATFASTAFEDWSSLTEVYSGSVSISNNKMEITFSTPYTYDGGNLLIGFHQTAYNATVSCTWKGTAQTGSTALYQTANSSHSWTGTVTSQSFLPKTTFTYLPTSTPKPRNLQVTEKTSESATLTWEAPANATPMSYFYHYKKATDAYFNQPIDNGHDLSVTINELAANTEYNFGVYANYSEGMSDYAEITFTTEATCLVPEGLAVNDMVATWTVGTATRWNLQYKKSSDATWTFVPGLTATTYDFNDLTLDANTDYDVQVQADCGNDDLSDWSESVTFRTPCDVNTIDATHQWSEGFESYNQGTSTSSGVAVTEIQCWERVLVNNSTNSPFVYRNYQYAASTDLASLELKTGTSAVMVALPQFSALIQNLNVAFNYNCTDNTNYTYTAELGYITNVADATTFVKLFDIPMPVTRGNHSTFSQDLYEAAAAANAPQGSRVAIRFASSYQYTSYPPSWNFDDFVVSYVSDCHKPTGLAITDGSITAHGATATWNGTNDSYKVMIGQENITINADFESNSIPADFTNSPTYPWTVATGGANNSGHCIIPGNHNVHSSNSDLTLEVNLAAPATLSFWAKISSEGSDYGRFLVDGTQKLNISGTSSYTSWAKYEYELAAGAHTLIWRYYKDGSINTGDDYFYVDDIVITAGVASWTEYTTTNQTYTFDNLTPNRTYQVKVKGVCGDEETPATAPVSFTTLIACPAPTGIHIVANSLTAHNVSIAWDGEDDEYFQYDLQQGIITDPEFTPNWGQEEMNHAPSWINLIPDTDYTLFVRRWCSASEQSDAVSISFHTPEACPAPTSFDVDDITNHTATLSWQGTSNEYQVSYRTAAYVEGLEERFDNSGLPTGWICYSGAVDDVLDGTVDLSSASGWSTNSYALGEYNIKANIFGSACYKWIVSPEFTFNGEAVVFDVALTDFGNSDPIENVGNQADDRFVVLVYADDEWHILREWNNSGSAYVYDEIPHTGTHVSIDLSLYSGKTIRVAFYGESTESGGDNDLHIDNVKSGTDVPAGEMQYASNLTEQTVTLSNLLAERKYEAWLIGDCGSEGSSTQVGPISFTTDIACPKPTSLTYSNVKSTSVELRWVGHGEEAWLVEFHEEGEAWINREVSDSQVTHEEGGVVFYSLNVLDPETNYCVKVRANCEQTYPGDGQSAYSNEECFTTTPSCAVENVTISDITHYTANVSWDGESADGFTVKYRTAACEDAPFKEDFERASSFANWTFTSMNTANNIASGVAGCISGVGHNNTYGFRFSSYSSADDYNQYLVSPELTVTGELKFYAKQYGSDDNIYVGYSTTTSDLDAFTWDEDALALTTSWAEFTHELPNNVKYIAFHYYGDYAYYAYLDDITIGAYEVPAGDWESVPADDSPANLNSLTAGTKYDLTVVPDCDATLASEIQQFTTVSADEKWFITDGNWGTASNWEPVGAPTIDQNVTLLANATIESTCVAEAKSINGTGTGTNAKTLTIKDGGKLKHLNSNVRATVEKEIRPYSTNYDEENYNNGDYYLIANPLTSYVTPDAENNHLLSGHYDLYRWDYTQDLEWLNYKASNFNLGYGAYGYLYANETGATLTYTGIINAYTSYKPRSCSASSNPENYDFPGWYLLGNPYLYDAYLATAGTNGTALPYIKMNTTGDGFENMPAGTPIEPMEGFFYQQATTSGYVYVVTSAPAVQSGSKLNMNLSRANKQLDNAILVFGGDQQLGKMTFRANSSKIFMPVEGKDYAITSVEGQVGEVPVSFVPESNGTYSLSFTSEEVSFSYLHLIDNMTGEDVDLLAGASTGSATYTFDARTTDYASRFKLVFAVGSSANDDTFGFVNASGNFCIFGIEGEATVQVIDVLGHVISSETFSGSYEKRINGAPGVYMVRLIQGNDVKVQKVVVRR